MTDPSLNPLAGIRIDDLDKPILRFRNTLNWEVLSRRASPGYEAVAFGNVGKFVFFVDVAYGRFDIVLR